MPNSRGVCYVAFGENYAWQCLHSARSVRAVSDIPIHVFANIELGPKWEALGNVTVARVDGPDESNRGIKTDLINHTPFDETLYLDTDTAVRSAAFLGGFDELAEHDVAGALWHY